METTEPRKSRPSIILPLESDPHGAHIKGLIDTHEIRIMISRRAFLHPDQFHRLFNKHPGGIFTSGPVQVHVKVGRNNGRDNVTLDVTVKLKNDDESITTHTNRLTHKMCLEIEQRLLDMEEMLSLRYTPPQRKSAKRVA